MEAVRELGSEEVGPLGMSSRSATKRWMTTLLKRLLLI